ncbi:MAG: adenine deaminase [Bacteroidota bacterium]|nr:adenine deaminase [Bacteroidota bacterium]
MNDNIFEISGNIVDVVNMQITKGKLIIKKGIIKEIVPDSNVGNSYIIPGFIDAHIHIESTMLVPSSFARVAIKHGTIATVSDPHEIANVLGIPGINMMIENAKKVPMKFYFGAPSCVPATSFETSGTTIGVKETEELLAMAEIKYLSEMMNFPGVINSNKEVIAKLKLAKKYNKPVDGHAPGLKGDDLKKYIEAGISTDHECSTIEEAYEKLSKGMNILIREGSAAKNFDELIGLIKEYPDKIMFCTDDLHPDDLQSGHINLLASRAVSKGYDPLKVLRCITYNPIKHYKLDVGLLQKNDPADFIIVNNLKDFKTESVYIDGICVAKNGKIIFNDISEKPVNNFKCKCINESMLKVKATSEDINVIEVSDGSIVTGKLTGKPLVVGGYAKSDLQRDVLKLVVFNRYKDKDNKPAIGFIKNFKLTKGAIASTVAHDSHNIIAVGTNDKDLKEAINMLIMQKGGVCAVDGENKTILPLPIAGLMTDESGEKVADMYARLDEKAKSFGSTLSAPFMTLSFMALLVIPELKLSDKGLFDVNAFNFIDLFNEESLDY